MLDILNADADLHDGNVDCSNYGCFEGIPSARKLAGEFLGCPAEQTLVLGSSSLLIEHDIAGMFWRCGSCGSEPWDAYEAAHGGKKVKFLCPVPGYDRHFGITADLGIENVPVAMTDNGPDMDEIERLVAADDSIKGIWCVPKYSNPTGITFSEDTVRRLVEMPTAAPDFRIFWDNAYCVHDLYDETDELANIFDLARAAGTEDRVVAFASTSKITFPGAGIGFIGASPAVIAEFSKRLKAGFISADKLNQLRHVRFLPTIEAVKEHMKKHAEFLRPRFEAVERKLTEGLGDTGCATWTHPRGGYLCKLRWSRGLGPEGRRALRRPGRQAHAGRCHLALWQGSARYQHPHRAELSHGRGPGGSTRRTGAGRQARRCRACSCRARLTPRAPQVRAQYYPHFRYVKERIHGFGYFHQPHTGDLHH